MIPVEAKIPGTPDHEDDILNTDPAYTQGRDDTRKGAVTKAADICARNCCKQVQIFYFTAPKNEAMEDTLYHSKPMIELYDCKQGRITRTINNYFLEDRASTQ